MGYWKDYMSEIEVRGYDDSDKSICSGCVGDKYFYKLIRTQGAKGYCSFCGKSTRNVFPMNAILASISTIIDRNYLPADGNAMYDQINVPGTAQSQSSKKIMYLSPLSI